ncbi:cation:proton antiporter [Hyphococcus flavus]|uniref:Cation:proton antiporter n=1 Tax=Hyphococcus flavus TaxID=1866326 RepID=A0AAE9ZFJ9_9PROT|nr:cation:proton antiporter [Hyphococcus flavus]WDI32032.1 cation:proton antiporter [Hyphococcus flavus]
MVLALAAVLCTATFWILKSADRRRSAALDAVSRAPVLLIAIGAAISIIWRTSSAPFAPSEWTAAGADVMLAALAFAAAAQFRISKLASVCPASFRLTIGGAPLFLIVCGLSAFILVPQLSFSAAFLLAGALTLNGAAFDRRAVTDAPAPSTLKSAVRLESAAILALGIPVAVMLEAIATAAPQGMPLVTPVYEAARSFFLAFAIGGGLGLGAAHLGNKPQHKNRRTQLAIGAGLLAVLISPVVGAHPVIAAAAAGLLWGEDTRAAVMPRVRLRRLAERNIAPFAYFGFGVLLGPRILQADLLSIVFAAAAVTVMRAGPRLFSLKKTTLPKESQMFLAWFGGAPGAASALFLISLFDAPSIVAQDAILTVGALAVTFGVVAARLTSRPLVKLLLKETALAKKRARFAG